MALKVLVAPLRYVQGPDALLQLGEQLRVIGIKNPLVLASPSAMKAVGGAIAGGLDAKGIAYRFVEFTGECTWNEIERVKNVCTQGGHDAIISCGGGKTLDTGRSAACESAVNPEKLPPEFYPRFGAGVACINVPTIAATDASTSAVSLVYTEEGVVEAVLAFPTNPTMVLVDTSVIAESPVRFLISGMGDALATYFEASMCSRTGTPSGLTGAQSTLTAQALGRLCLDILLEYGAQAKSEVEAGVPGPGLEAVVEANVLLSGLGFESGGLSAAHAVGQAFHHIHERFEVPLYHGELVAFGTLVQLLLEGRKPDYLEKIFGFCKAVGLPTTFEEMTIKNPTERDLQTVADFASRHVIMRSMPGANAEPDSEGRFYDQLAIFHALKATDAFGKTLIHGKQSG